MYNVVQDDFSKLYPKHIKDVQVGGQGQSEEFKLGGGTKWNAVHRR